MTTEGTPNAVTRKELSRELRACLALLRGEKIDGKRLNPSDEPAIRERVKAINALLGGK